MDTSSSVSAEVLRSSRQQTSRPESSRQIMRTLIVIPARMHSTRLPGKPMIDIAGEPMIAHVWRRAAAADIGRIVVATDTEAIAEAVRKVGGEAVLTRADHATG